MANGNNHHDKLEARLDALAADFTRRSEVRDREIARHREELNAQVADLQALLTDLAARLAGAEKAADRSPSWLNVLAVAAAAAGLVGGLARYGLSSTAEPLRESHVRISKELEKVEDRQMNVIKNLSMLNGQVKGLDERVDDIDKLGPRRKGEGQ